MPKYRDVWFEWEGKPLLMAFDPMTLTLPLSATYPISYTIRNWTGRPKGDDTVREGWDWFFGPPQEPISGLSNDGVAFVYPRFDEAPEGGRGQLHHLAAALHRSAAHAMRLRKAMAAAGVSIVRRSRWSCCTAGTCTASRRTSSQLAAMPPRPSIGYSYVDRTRKYWQALSAGWAIIPSSYCDNESRVSDPSP